MEGLDPPGLDPEQILPRRNAQGREAAAELDLFDRVQLESVLEVCARSASLSAAGRELFARSRLRRTSRNDADRLKKYLARFGLDWAGLKGAGAQES